ncbi:peptidoglycan-binding protein [Devosia sp. YIM 151766]|uniref:peptidoglycan-binding domain-containing protein n=1 Tax=Devosia sp. YIM 151766 TaxID=3017325 RepID=UPI00255CABAB|nr:peptidoglycan-binding protein [Devosia sp. YIM 151766]WIY53649.1 peptidoglycan-binding protein [Devosia sp. YIM 151766]
MNAATLSQPLLMAGGVLLGSLSRAGQWAFSRYMRAPMASTGLLAMVTLTALAGSNALYFQTAEHPSPFFAPARDNVAALPTSIVDRPANALPEIAASSPAIVPAATPQTIPETTGSVAPSVPVPEAPVGNAQMFAVQKKLFELNLFSGTIDGYYGPQTAEAIRAFEQRNGMIPTGGMDPAVLDAIVKSDASGRTTAPVDVQPQAAAPAAAAPIAQAAPVTVAVTAPPQDQVVARLPTLSPAEQVFDEVAQTAANTIDSIIAAVDGARTPPQAMANPPIPSASVAATAQPMPQPVREVISPPAQQVAALASSASPVRMPPANDTELVMQIQRGLASLGFFQAPVDGKPGPETARAIREFENFHRYRMTGQVQPDLVELLLKAGATI